MDPQNTSPQQTTQAQNPPQQAPQAAPGQTTTQPKKTSPWVWILGGCLVICVLIVVTIGLLGWWGARTIKNKYDQQAPGMQKMIEDAQREQKEWEEMSNDIQQGLSDIETQIPQDMPQ